MANNEIGCSVAECRHINDSQTACTLSRIHVGRTSPNVNSKASTECDSFELR